MKFKISEAINLSAKARISGEPSRAKHYLAAILKKLPNHSVANHAMGEILVEAGQSQTAVKFLIAALDSNPDSDLIWRSYVEALISLKRFDETRALIRKAFHRNISIDITEPVLKYVEIVCEAFESQSSEETSQQLLKLYKGQRFLDLIALCRIAIQRYPHDCTLWNFLGITKNCLGRSDEALSAFRKAVNLNPQFVDGLNNLGVVLKSLGRIDEAIETYHASCAITPENADSYFNLALAFQYKGLISDAELAYKKAILIKPSYAEAYNNLGNILYDRGNVRDAERFYSKASKLKSEYTDALFNLGKINMTLGKLSEACSVFSKILKFSPHHRKAFVSLAIALRLQMKLDEALRVCKRALEIAPNYPEIYLARGNIFVEDGNFEGAKDDFQKAISISPKNAKALYNMGVLYHRQGKFIDAVEFLKRTLVVNPNFALAEALLLHLLRQICEWNALEQKKTSISLLGTSNGHVAPFMLLSLEDNPLNHLLRSKNFSKTKFKNLAVMPLSKPCKHQKKITVGYFSADFNHHPVSILMTGVFEKHDRSRFQINGYSIRDCKRDPVRLRLETAFDYFRDVSTLTDKEIVDFARKDEVDIAIDLTGYTEKCRTGIFALRAAPIQINYLGYPGSMGADFMDYIIADKFLIPDEASRFYQEKIIYMPHSYQAQDDTALTSQNKEVSNTLKTFSDNFIFCAINNSYKINAKVFDIWMRLLNTIDNSILWLLDSNVYAKRNLIKEAERRGVKKSKLVFTGKVSYQNYLEQFRKADLFLDTFDYNAGATASAVLSSGLPLITKSGRSYSARMAGSLLKALDLPQLITKTEKEYENLAINLARNPKKLESVKINLLNNIKDKPLFQTRRFTQNLEKGYEQAFMAYTENKSLKNIYIED